MNFDITGDLNPATWFDFEDGGRVAVRLCAGGDYRNIRKQVTKKKAEYRNAQRFEVQEVNEDLLNELLWDFCIVGWENLFDKNGKDIPCTKENKILLMGHSIKFSNFVTTCLDKLSSDQRDREEEVSKN